MANVSLDVGINNSVSPQHRQAEDRDADQRFMTVLAQASEQEEAKKAALESEDNINSQRDQVTVNDQGEGDDSIRVQSRPDIPLKLDDSNLPKKKSGPDVALHVDKSDDDITHVNTTNPDTLLSQITASNNQKTNVEHHLASVPKAIRDHVGQVEVIADDIVITEGKKGPIDLIGPIVSQGDKSTDSKQALLQTDQSKSDIAQTKLRTDSEVFKGVETGPRVSEGPVDDPKQIIDSGKNAAQGVQNKLRTDKELFNGEIKSREWFLHDKKPAVEASELKSHDDTSVSEISYKGIKTQDLDAKAQGVDKKINAEIKAPQQSTDVKVMDDNGEKQIQNSSNSEVSTLATQIKSAIAQGKETVQASGAIQSEIVSAQTKSDKALFDNQAPIVSSKESTDKALSELKALVDQLSPQEKKQLEAALNEKLNSNKPVEPQVKRLESALYSMVSDKPDEGSAPRKENNVVSTAGSDDGKQKLNSVISDLKASQEAKPELSYNSTKVSASKEQISTEPNKQNVEIAVSEEGAEFTADSEQEQTQNNGSQQRHAANTNVDNIFKAIRSLGTEQIQSKEEFEQVIHQVEQSRQNQQIVQQQSAAQVKVPQEQGLMQTLNLARNDAAKMMQEKVNMMINLNNQEAEIRLDPAELGSMQIRIRSDAEQAQINFVVQNQQAKELLEESMPKLKEMLEEQGIQLGDSSIEQHSEGNSGDEDNEHNAQGKLANESSEAQNNKEQSVTSRKQSDSAIDYYA
ncbi:flagellar hook-length control protein FliK [Pseudoalteromonas umbrosa]|uniref:flagellar hook-length control protein FliK n=1 Tax=Pseudoalteromonas umbrosa TaxID=3048489 RepID=UPI0024C23FEF|nr:flagellar hook-length control protein FliK [Pseudoalteromonas sp. B95]MDK1285646.1 flagellar hook-length control protein FliK [Pseudoalteromonas sp. B95]